MDILNKIEIRVKIDEREFMFLMPYDAPLSICYAAIEQAKYYVFQRIKESEESERKEEEKNSESHE